MVKGRKQTTKTLILAAASELFSTNGIKAVGINSIIERAGVAKMSLYNHFQNRDALVIAYLKEQEKDYMSIFETAVDGKNAFGPQTIIILIETLQRRLFDKAVTYRDAHMRAIIEYSDPNHPVHHEVIAFRERLLQKLAELLKKASFNESDQLAANLLLLIDGAQVAANPNHSYKGMKNLVQTFLDDAVSNKDTISNERFTSINNHDYQGKVPAFKPLTKYFLERVETLELRTLEFSKVCGSCGRSLESSRFNHRCSRCECTCKTSSECLVHWICACDIDSLCRYHTEERPDILHKMTMFLLSNPWTERATIMLKPYLTQEKLTAYSGL